MKHLVKNDGFSVWFWKLCCAKFQWFLYFNSPAPTCLLINSLTSVLLGVLQTKKEQKKFSAVEKQSK